MTEEEKENIKNDRAGMATSIIIHAALLIAFLFVGMSYMVPPPGEEGVVINFGFDDAGMESENPEVNEESEVAETTPTETVPQETVPDDIITQDSEDAPAIDEKKEEPKEVVEEEPEKKEEPKPDPNLINAMEKWKNKKNEPSGGDGNQDQAGDQGREDGDPNSNNYEGHGGGNSGIGFSLAGRSMVGKPVIRDDSQEEGKVVVDIVVDRNGKVIRATPGARGSTTTSSNLYRKAKEAALRTRFNAKSDAAVEQRGQMTFIFILN